MERLGGPCCQGSEVLRPERAGQGEPPGGDSACSRALSDNRLLEEIKFMTLIIIGVFFYVYSDYLWFSESKSYKDEI